jgi:PEP-CTERM motif
MKLRHKVWAVAPAAVALAVLAGGSASAAKPTHGAQALASLHRCTPLPTGGGCPAFNSALKIQVVGGPGADSAAASVTANPGSAQDGSFAKASAGFGDLSLPVLHAQVDAVGSDSRMNGTAEAFETYTYQGAGPSPFSIAGTLQFEDSSVGSADVIAAGSGGYQLYIGIYAASQFTGIGSFGQCGAAGVLGSYLTPGIGTLQGGAFSVPVATQSCGGGPIMLTPGEQVVIDTAFILITNRGGFADASHSFTTFFDPALGEDVTSDLRSNLSAAGIPEPATWALMLAGFGLAGAGLRTARRGPKAPIRP